MSLSLVLVAAIIALHLYLDVYGLFSTGGDRRIEMHHNERTSKHLMSFRYIPERFEGLLVGASTSGNLKPGLVGGDGLYNASINGGNITETRIIAENAIRRGDIRYVIICLDPALTASSGRKTSYIDPKEYWSALGSFTTLKLHINKLLKRKVDFFRDSYDGALNYNTFAVGRNGREAVETYVEQGGWEFAVEGAAFGELQGFLALLRSEDIEVFAFFFPLARSLRELGGDRFIAYKRQMLSAFLANEPVWDFNDPEYGGFAADHDQFYDGIHLRDEAAVILADKIRREFERALSLAVGG